MHKYNCIFYWTFTTFIMHRVSTTVWRLKKTDMAIYKDLNFIIYITKRHKIELNKLLEIINEIPRDR